MKALIEKILITERVRKEITKIDELAADIKANGLLHPITVMSLDGGEYRLLAGLRRLKAMQSLGETDIDVKVVVPANAEAALRIEISENEQREPFTFSETVDYGRLLDEIEKVNGKERMSQGGKHGKAQEGSDGSRYLLGRKSSDVVGEKIGMSGRQYERAKYIADKASPEIIDELDKGKRSIYGTYSELKAKEKAVKASETYEPEIIEADEESDNDSQEDSGTNSDAATTPIDNTSEKAEKTIKLMESEVVEANEEADNDNREDNSLENGAVIMTAVNTPPVDPPKSNVPPANILSKADQEAEARNIAFNALSPQKKVVELQRQLKEERARAAHAESELERLKELRHNDIFHKDGIINNLKTRLASAEARIKELEDKFCAD